MRWSSQARNQLRGQQESSRESSLSIISKHGGNWHVLIPFLFIIFPFNTFWIFKAKLWFSWSNPEQYPQTSSSLLHYIKAQRCLTNGGQSNFHDPLISLLKLKSPLKWWKYFFRDKKSATHISLLIAYRIAHNVHSYKKEFGVACSKKIWWSSQPHW